MHEQREQAPEAAAMTRHNRRAAQRRRAASGGDGAGELRQLREDCLRLGDMVEGFRTELDGLSNEIGHLSGELVEVRSMVARLAEAAGDGLPDDPSQRGAGPSESIFPRGDL